MFAAVSTCVLYNKIWHGRNVCFRLTAHLIYTRKAFAERFGRRTEWQIEGSLAAECELELSGRSLTNSLDVCEGKAQIKNSNFKPCG